MRAILKSLIVQWDSQKNQRLQLQYAFLVLAAILIIVAGIASFFRPDLAQTIAGCGLFLILVYITNGFAWALLRAFVVPYADSITPKTPRARQTKKK